MSTPQSSSLPQTMTPTVFPLAGVLILILSSWALSGLDASGKWIMGFGVPLLVMCWFRYVVHLGLVLALVLPVKGRKILRSSGGHNIALFGAGNLGQAIASSDIFADHGFQIVAVFDVDQDRVGTDVSGVPVRDFADLERVVEEHVLPDTQAVERIAPR